jgi:integrase
LGLQIQPHRRGCGSKFNFRYINQEWLKEAVKRFIKYKASIGLSFSTLMKQLEAFNDFSLFLDSQPQIKQFSDLNRSTVIKYLEYNNQRKLCASTKSKRISALSSLLETGVENKWFSVEPYLIHKNDYPKPDKVLPRYIPDDVVRQLNQYLDGLPESVMRMVLVIQECGLRIGELSQLPINCLKQDAKGGWFIQFMRWKMKFETTIPISIELAQVIKEQQEYIKQHLGSDFPYLFCGHKQGSRGFVPAKKVMDSQAFIRYLKKLADKFDICDSTGKRWNFQSHQFRHTVGTRMINNGVPQHIVQRYLGHESPQMTAVYAHIHDSTAQANGWERQIQVNQDVKHSLEKIIATLEGNRDA